MSSSRYKEEREYTMYTGSKGAEEYKKACQFNLLESLLQEIVPRYRNTNLAHTNITNMYTLYTITSEIRKLLNDLQ